MGNKSSKISQNAKIIEVLPSESKSHFAGMHETTSIGSVYRVLNSDFELIKTNLIDRIKKILSANTWLMSRLYTLSNPKRCGLAIEDRFLNTENYIICSESKGLVVSEDTSYDDYRNILADDKFKIENSVYLADNDEKVLTKFGIINNPDNNTFAIVLTINHVIADGSTVYKIWKMLDENEEIISLQSERNMKFEREKHVEKLTSLAPKGLTLDQFMTEFMKNNLMPMILKGFKQLFQIKNRYPKNEWVVMLDNDAIEAKKNEWKNQGVDFVSTNDIITSWLTELEPKMDNMTMIINLRDRIEGVNSNLAGNYLALVVLRNKHMQTPAECRKFLNNVLKPGYEWEIPSYKDYRKYIGGMHTNWSSFYHHVQPQGTEQVLHFPVVPDVSYIWSGVPVGGELDLITFRPNPGQTACFIFSRRRKLDVNKLLAQNLVKKQLMKMK